MKKLLSILTICTVLSGCVSFAPANKNGAASPAVSKKATLNYKLTGQFSCGVYAFDAQNKWDKYLGGLPHNNYFAVAPKHTDYTLLLAAEPKECRVSALSCLATLFTVGILPVKVSKGTIVIRPRLTDNNENIQIDLPAKEVNISTWSSWFLVPFGTDAGKLAVARLGEEIFKEAAAMAYNKHSDLYTKGQCLSDECSVKLLLAADKVSSDDIALAAANAKTFDDFNAIRAKGKADNCQTAIALLSNPYNITPKEKPMYWQLVDFYKEFCADYRNNLSDLVGITKEKLVEKLGTPTSAYKVNADSESLTYKKSRLNGEVVETSEQVFTVDRGIVTAQKDK